GAPQGAQRRGRGIARGVGPRLTRAGGVARQLQGGGVGRLRWLGRRRRDLLGHLEVGGGAETIGTHDIASGGRTILRTVSIAWPASAGGAQDGRAGHGGGDRSQVRGREPLL